MFSLRKKKLDLPTADEALAHLVERSGREFDARVVAALERVRETSWRWPFVEG